MKNDEHFWWTTLVRGFLALLVGSAIMVIPDMARSLLLLPIAITISILGLAVYGVLDSVLVFITSYMAVSARARVALRLQGVVGITVGILLYRVFFNRVHLHWFLALVAVQALSTAAAEFTVARHAATHSLSNWNYAGSVVALVFSGVYAYIAATLGENMEPQRITWLVFGYLLAFGIAQSLTAARMLYADRADILVKPQAPNAR
ncbi:MAG: hypothetical protein V4555_06100 [Acidobacteriota bacterium]